MLQRLTLLFDRYARKDTSACAHDEAYHGPSRRELGARDSGRRLHLQPRTGHNIDLKVSRVEGKEVSFHQFLLPTHVNRIQPSCRLISEVCALKNSFSSPPTFYDDIPAYITDLF
jgi:hypothetical protein